MRASGDIRADGSSFARAGGHKTAPRWAPLDVWWHCGHDAYSLCSGSLEDSPNDGASVAALHVQTIPIDGSSKCPSTRPGRHVGRRSCCVYARSTRIFPLERVMNSIRNGLGMRETEIAREPSRP